eukprot:2949520-Pleurochrysis_carterae.AAC.1
MPRVAVPPPIRGRRGSATDATPAPARAKALPPRPVLPQYLNAIAPPLLMLPRGWWVGEKARSPSCALAPPSRVVASVRTMWSNLLRGANPPAVGYRGRSPPVSKLTTPCTHIVHLCVRAHPALHARQNARMNTQRSAF